MSRFAAAEQVVSDAIDGWYGDKTRIQRQSSGGYFAGAAEGDPFVVTGIVDENPITIRVQDEGSYDGMQPQLGGDKWHVSYDISKFPVGEDLPDQGDHITILLEDGVTANPAFPKLRVTRRDHDGIGRVVCVCTKAE